MPWNEINWTETWFDFFTYATNSEQRMNKTQQP